MLLAVPRDEASARIMEQIAEGEGFLPAAAHSVARDDLFAKRRSWVDYTIDLLNRLFTTDELAQEFASAQDIHAILHPRRADQFRLAVDNTRRQIDTLRSIHRRLEFFEAQGTDPSVFSIVAKDGSVQSAVAVWVQDNSVRYIGPEGTAGHLPLDSVNRQATRRANSEKNLTLALPAAQGPSR